jgi:hypothetical protein
MGQFLCVSRTGLTYHSYNQMIGWLQYAEDHGEKVHIIGHHPPRSCMASFGWNFNRIVNRFVNPAIGTLSIIKGIFSLDTKIPSLVNSMVTLTLMNG